MAQYVQNRYPEKEQVITARDLAQDILSQRKDNVALLNRMVQKQDDMLDSAEDTEGVELFFKSQRAVFDEAVRQMERVSREQDYFATDPDTQEVFRTISAILAMPKPYNRIGELPELIGKVKAAYQSLLELKKEEVAETIRQCMQDVHQLAGEARNTEALLQQADHYFAGKRDAAQAALSLTELDAMITQLLNHKDTVCKRMEVMAAPAPEPQAKGSGEDYQPAPPPKKIATVRRYDLCSVKRLQSRDDIDAYVEGIRQKLYQTLESCDGVQVN